MLSSGFENCKSMQPHVLAWRKEILGFVQGWNEKKKCLNVDNDYN